MKRFFCVFLSVVILVSVFAVPVYAVVISTTALLFGASAVVALAIGVLGLQQSGSDSDFQSYCNEIASSERVQAAVDALGFSAAFASGWLPILLRREMVDQLQPDGSTVQVQKDTTYIPEELLLAIANELIASGAYAGSQTVIPPSTGWSLLPGADQMPTLTNSLTAQSLSTTYDFFGEFLGKATGVTYKQGLLDSYEHLGKLLDSIGYSRSAPIIIGYSVSRSSGNYIGNFNLLLIDRATTATIKCMLTGYDISLNWDGQYYSYEESEKVNGYTAFAAAPVYFADCQQIFSGEDVYMRYRFRMSADSWMSDIQTAYSDSYSDYGRDEVLYIPYGTDLTKLRASAIWGETLVVSQYGGELSEPIVPPSAVPVEPQPGVISGDTIGDDVIGGLDQLVGKIDGWQDYLDKGVEIPLEGTGAAVGSQDTSVGLEIDIPVSVDQAGNPAISDKPQDITSSQDGVVSDATDVVGASANVQENQTVIDSFLDWAEGYIDFDSSIFRKFPFSILYDIYAFFSVVSTGTAPGVASIMDSSPGNLPSVSDGSSSAFEPVVEIPIKYGYIDTEITIDLSPYSDAISFIRICEGLLFSIGLIAYELNRRKE